MLAARPARSREQIAARLFYSSARAHPPTIFNSFSFFSLDHHLSVSFVGISIVIEKCCRSASPLWVCDASTLHKLGSTSSRSDFNLADWASIPSNGLSILLNSMKLYKTTKFRRWDMSCVSEQSDISMKKNEASKYLVIAICVIVPFC